MNKIVKGLMIAGTLGASLMAFTRTADAKDKDGNIVIVIDPGHGGEDPKSYMSIMTMWLRILL